MISLFDDQQSFRLPSHESREQSMEFSQEAGREREGKNTSFREISHTVQCFQYFQNNKHKIHQNLNDHENFVAKRSAKRDNKRTSIWSIILRLLSWCACFSPDVANCMLLPCCSCGPVRSRPAVDGWHEFFERVQVCENVIYQNVWLLTCIVKWRMERHFTAVRLGRSTLEAKSTFVKSFSSHMRPAFSLWASYVLDQILGQILP